jgi:hypothetical protein
MINRTRGKNENTFIELANVSHNSLQNFDYHYAKILERSSYYRINFKMKMCDNMYKLN